MNNDGWGQVGASVDDNRIAGEDLQHYRQNRTADEGRWPARRVITQPSESGGPMKHQGLNSRLDESLGMRHGPESQHMQSMADRRHESKGMHHQLEEEKNRHHEAVEHHQHHLAKHYGRSYDSQHGHDDYSYKRG